MFAGLEQQAITKATSCLRCVTGQIHMKNIKVNAVLHIKSCSTVEMLSVNAYSVSTAVRLLNNK